MIYARALLAMARATNPAQSLAAADAVRTAVESNRIPKWEAWIVQAIGCIEAREFRRALTAVRECVRGGGGADATVAELFGMCAWAEGVRCIAIGQPSDAILKEALAALNEGLTLSPDSIRGLYYRALTCRAMGNRSEARRDLDRAITLDPRNVGCLVARGVLRYETGDPTGAIEDYSTALGLQPGLAAVWSNRAQAKRSLRDMEGAIQDLDKAIELDASQPGPWVNRSAAKRAMGDLDGAVGDASRAIQLDGNHPGAWLNRGNAKLDQKDLAGAVADWERFVELAPAHGFAPQVRADIDRVRALMKEEDK